MILIFEQDLTHYRVLFYDYLANKVNEKLLVVYGDGEPSSYHILEGKDSDRTFQTKEIRRKWFGKSIYYNSFSDIKKIVNSNSISCVIHRGAIRNLSLYREIRFFQSRGIPVILRGIGFSNKRDFNPSKNIIDKYHRFIINSCDAYLSYTDGSKKILDKFYEPDKVFVAVNTLNSELMDNHYYLLSQQGKESIKRELNLSLEKYIIHVGRLSARKRLKDLIDIYSIVKKKHNVGLVLVGDGDEREKLQCYVSERGIQDVLFTGAISSENIKVSKYIFSSDVFLITGNIGLSINHAFFFGVPVVGYIAPCTSSRPIDYIQTPEHEHLIDGYNGAVVNNYDLNEFSEAVENIFSSNRIKENAYSYAQNHLTVEGMAEGYINAITYAKEKNIRSLR